MELIAINSREDLDAIQGTPAHTAFMSLLQGTLWRLQKDDTAGVWVAVEDSSTIMRFGFTRTDFANTPPPDLPVYTPPPSVIAAKVQALWSAADNYTSGYISGVAIGLLTIGVIQGKPKALAVTAWSSGIWGDYYGRKALVSEVSVDDLDFAGHGAIPHSVPELQAELGL